MGVAISQLIDNNAVDSNFSPYPNIDAKYGPYTTVAAANTTIPKSKRVVGLTVGIKSGTTITEYWYSGGVEDSNLIKKTQDVDLSGYYTKVQQDAVTATLRKAIDTNTTNISSVDNRVSVLEGGSGGGSYFPYTRAHVKNTHIRINNVAAGTYQVAICPLKYAADIVVSFTTDDANASTLSVVWATFNGRPVSLNKTQGGSVYWYHANQLLQGDVPPAIINESGTPIPIYTDVFGVNHRLKQGVAIWPYAANKDGYMMDRESVVNPNAGNLYRFMTPYLMWEDCELLKRYGVDFYWHNIGTEDFGTDMVEDNIIQGLMADFDKTKAKIGIDLKVLARPDGNNIFLTTMESIPKVDFAVAEGSPATDLSTATPVDMYHKTYLRTFKEDTAAILSDIRAIAEAIPANRKWYHFCCHTATSTWTDLCSTIAETYRGETGSKLWFATAGELYEYMYFRMYSKISNIKTGTERGVNYVEFDLTIPYKENFRYKDLTLALTGVNQSEASILTIVGQDAWTGEKLPQLLVKNAGATIYAHVGIEQTVIENTEWFIAKYRDTGYSQWREDALHNIQGLREDLRLAYTEEINSIGNVVPITSISVSPTTLNLVMGTPETVTVTALPANNTQMDSIVATAYSPEAVKITRQSVSNGVAVYSIEPLTSQDTTVTFSRGGISATVDVSIDEVVVPITGVTIFPEELYFIDNIAGLLRVTGLPSNNTQMADIKLRDLNTANSWAIASTITANVNTFRIQSRNKLAIGSYSGTFNLTIGDIVRPVPYILEITRTDIAITSITIENSANPVTGSPVHFTCTCLPADNTSMVDETLQVEVPTAGDILTNKSITGNVLSFDITFATAGDKTVYVRDTNTSNRYSKTLTVAQASVSSHDDKTLCLVNWGLNELDKQRSYNDTLYGGTINLNEMIYEATVERTPLLSKSGKTLTGFERSCQVVPDLLAAAGLSAEGVWLQSAKQSADLTNVFSIATETLIEYRYLNSYSTATLNGWAIKVPNGTYRVKFLASTTEPDTWNNCSAFSLNETPLLGSLTGSIQNNTAWTPEFTVTVTNGYIWFYMSVPARSRCGINAIEIQWD